MLGEKTQVLLGCIGCIGCIGTCMYPSIHHFPTTWGISVALHSTAAFPVWWSRGAALVATYLLPGQKHGTHMLSRRPGMKPLGLVLKLIGKRLNPMVNSRFPYFLMAISSLEENPWSSPLTHHWSSITGYPGGGDIPQRCLSPCQADHYGLAAWLIWRVCCWLPWLVGTADWSPGPMAEMWLCARWHRGNTCLMQALLVSGEMIHWVSSVCSLSDFGHLRFSHQMSPAKPPIIPIIQVLVAGILVSAPSDLSVAIPAVEQVRFPYAYVNTFGPSVKLWQLFLGMAPEWQWMHHATSLPLTSVDHRGPGRAPRTGSVRLRHLPKHHSRGQSSSDHKSWSFDGWEAEGGEGPGMDWT